MHTCLYHTCYYSRYKYTCIVHVVCARRMHVRFVTQANQETLTPPSTWSHTWFSSVNVYPLCQCGGCHSDSVSVLLCSKCSNVQYTLFFFLSNTSPLFQTLSIVNDDQ